MSTDSVELGPKALEALATDPNTVHINLLRGSLARPSIAQIIHIYGADNLRAALSAVPLDTGVAVAWRWRLLNYATGKARDWHLAETEDEAVRRSGRNGIDKVEIQHLYAHPSKSYEDGVRDAASLALSFETATDPYDALKGTMLPRRISEAILALLPSTGAGK
jgi:hypothetical protein